MKQLKINHLAVLAVVVLQQLIPMAWYGVFAEKWIALNEKSVEDFSDGSPLPYIVSIIASVAMAYFLAWLFRTLEVESWQRGVKIAIMAFGSLVFFHTMTIYLFSLRPLELALMDEGNNFLGYLLAGALLGGWRKYA